MDNKSEKEKLFKSLIDGYAKAFPKHSKKQGQLEVSKIWREMKKTDDLVKSCGFRMWALNMSHSSKMWALNIPHSSKMWALYMPHSSKMWALNMPHSSKM